MESAAPGMQILQDLVLTVEKLLGRPVVQVQLVVGMGAVVVAWLLARFAVRALDKRYAAGAEKTGRLGARLAYHLLRQTLFPLLALLAVSIAGGLLHRYSIYVGLVDGIVSLLVLFLLYRLVLGFLDCFCPRPTARRYHWRLLAPLFAVLVVTLMLRTLPNAVLLARTPFFTLQDGAISLGALFLATFGFYIWVTVIGLVKALLDTLLSRRPEVNMSTAEASLTVAQYSLIAVGLLGMLSVLQLNPATVAAITGGLAVGVGFALQDIFRNFLGGMIVLFDGSVRPGDLVEVAGAEGEVDKLSVRATVVRTFDNIEYIVPNQEWLGSTVKVLTHTERRVRLQVKVGVSYDANPHTVAAVLVAAAQTHPEVLADPAPTAVLAGFGDSSLDFTLFAWVADAKVRGRVAGELRLKVWDALAANNITIPYPQQDLHLRSGWPPT